MNIDMEQKPIVMQSKYTGSCKRCLKKFELGQDITKSEDDGGWVHFPLCEKVIPPEVTKSVIADGTYTVVWPDKGYITLRFKTAKPEVQGFWKDKQIVAFLSGSDNTRDFTNIGTMEGTELKLWGRYKSLRREYSAATSIIMADPKSAGEAYALKSNNCYVCGRTLTVPFSISRGVGPICDGRL